MRGALTRYVLWFVLLLAGVSASAAAQAQDGLDEPTTVDDVIVRGRALETAVEQFVESLAAPARMRGLARWNTAICVDAVNFQPDVRAEIVRRTTEVATALDVALQKDGCAPNIVIMGAADGAVLADAVVDRFRSKFFRFGSTRSNRGAAALTSFRRSDAPVRWWHVSLPVNVITGAPTIRLPGEPAVALPCYSRSVSLKEIDLAGFGGSRTGRSCNAVTDQIVGLWMIVDAQATDGFSLEQLADYIAFIAMAQVDPEADLASFDTILNLFENPQGYSGITEWDEAYLISLYQGHSERLDPAEQTARMIDLFRGSGP